MPAFRHEDNLGAPFCDRVADQSLALGIALSGIDHVDTGVERGIQNLIDGLLRDRLVADLRPAESKSAHPEPGLSQHAIFDCHKSGSLWGANERGKDAEALGRAIELGAQARRKVGRRGLVFEIDEDFAGARQRADRDFSPTHPGQHRRRFLCAGGHRRTARFDRAATRVFRFPRCIARRRCRPARSSQNSSNQLLFLNSKAARILPFRIARKSRQQREIELQVGR